MTVVQREAKGIASVEFLIVHHELFLPSFLLFHSRRVVVVNDALQYCRSQETVCILSIPLKKSTYLHVLLWVFQIIKETLVLPDDSTLLVGRTVGISILLTGLFAKESVEIGTLLVSPALIDGVALGTLGLEDLGSLLFVGSSLFLSHFGLFRRV